MSLLSVLGLGAKHCLHLSGVDTTAGGARNPAHVERVILIIHATAADIEDDNGQKDCRLTGCEN